MNADANLPDLNELPARLNTSGPRYTCFPTADRFVEAFAANEYKLALAQRRSGLTATGRAMSVSVHIPFCETQCYFCACNKIITRQHGHASAYLSHLSREVALHTAELGLGQPVNQLYVGGGTPTFLRDEELGSLMSLLRENFKLVPSGDFAIEIDPRTVGADRLDVLQALGFNRFSIGVQDLDPAVQKAVHRMQPTERVAQLLQQARERNFASINVDLMLGLPQQTPESFERTLSQVIEWRSDRISLYTYAHQPTHFKAQRHIDGTTLPSDAAKREMHRNAMAALLKAGYVFIGLDCFALPTDALAIAKRQGRLHRNLQGFSAQPDGDSIGLGVSAIGRVGASYSQNTKSLEEYADRLSQGLLPVASGISLSRDDVIRRAVIMALMCQDEVSFESIELGHLINFRHYFASEMVSLEPFIEQGLLVIDDEGIQVSELGAHCVPAMAKVFDRYLQADHTRALLSKVI